MWHVVAFPCLDRTDLASSLTQGGPLATIAMQAVSPWIWNNTHTTHWGLSTQMM